ncbi:MAG: DUF4388 domain-containing protein [Myxococcales bacterium]|nr:DUF4388 domain-containing protein [Myxococcales bacterium]
MPPRRYYFKAVDDSVLGPISLNVVAEMVMAQKVKANTPVSLDGKDFRPMKAFPELATLLSVDATEEPEAVSADILQEEPTYQGDITEVSIPKLLYHFSASRVTGRLQLTNQNIEKNLFLMNGKVVAAESNLPRDQLGPFLVRKGRFSEEQLDDILQKLAGRMERLSDYLIHSRMISPHELFEHLREQLLEKVYEVFHWRVGRYAFFEGQEFKGSLLPINFNPWETIAEGVRRGYELAELRDLLMPYGNYLIVPGENSSLHLNQLGLMPRELKVFKLAQGQRTLHAINEEMGIGEENLFTVLSMVYLGLELELLALGEQIHESSAAELDDGINWEQDVPREAPAAATGSDAGAESTGAAVTDEGAQAAEAVPLPGTPVKAAPRVTREEQELLETLNKLKEQDHFERLGLPRNALAKDVSKAFLQAARRFHPDQLSPETSARIRDLTSEVFALLNEAQQTLTNDARRAEYLAGLEAGAKDGQVDVGNIVQAEMLFQKGEVLVNNRKFEEAQKVFDEALKLNPDEGEFLIYRGYAAFFAKPNADSFYRQNCLDNITRGLKMRDNNVANGYLFLGRIQKAMGDEEAARKSFKKALSLEHNHLEAQRELRLMSMRDEKKGGLFGKKK